MLEGADDGKPAEGARKTPEGRAKRTDSLKGASSARQGSKAVAAASRGATRQKSKPAQQAPRRPGTKRSTSPRTKAKNKAAKSRRAHPTLSVQKQRRLVAAQAAQAAIEKRGLAVSTVDDEGEEGDSSEFEVEEVLERKMLHRDMDEHGLFTQGPLVLKYVVSWEGYPEEDNSAVTPEVLARHAREMMEAFDKAHAGSDDEWTDTQTKKATKSRRAHPTLNVQRQRRLVAAQAAQAAIEKRDLAVSTVDDEGEEGDSSEFEVEEVLECKMLHRDMDENKEYTLGPLVKKYVISWVGYPEEDNSAVTPDVLAHHASEMMEAFDKAHARCDDEWTDAQTTKAPKAKGAGSADKKATDATDRPENQASIHAFFDTKGKVARQEGKAAAGPQAMEEETGYTTPGQGEVRPTKTTAPRSRDDRGSPLKPSFSKSGDGSGSPAKKRPKSSGKKGENRGQLGTGAAQASGRELTGRETKVSERSQDQRGALGAERGPGYHNDDDVEGDLGSTDGENEGQGSASETGGRGDGRARSRSPGADQRGGGAGDHGLTRTGEECMEENTGR